MKMDKLKLKLLITSLLILFAALDSFSQRVLNNNQLLKKGLEAAFYLNKGDEYSLRSFLTEKEGLVLDTQNSKSDLLVFSKQLQNPITEPEGAVQFLAIVVDKTTKDHRIQLLYSHQENGRMYNINSSFINELKYNNLFFEGNNGMYAYMKGGQRNNIESMKFICGVVPNHLLDMISFQIFILHNKGNYSLQELLSDF
jgi:hypothetical protein